jgi:DNA-binding MarR family transcriptional regulator
MNDKQQSKSENLKALQILDELSKDDSLTQRDLSKRLGIALGLVNSYVKNLIKKGYITIKSIPPKRYAYYITPKGLTEKTRLTYNLLEDYTRIYREARTNLKKLFNDIQSSGARRVVFAGADEVAEIAYITLQDTNMELISVVDEEMAGKEFFDLKIQPFKALKDMEHDCVMVTSYLRRESIYSELLRVGVKEEDIKVIFRQ